MPASSSWVTGSENSSASPASSSRRFAVRPVTSRNTESASASSVLRRRIGQQAHDVPQQVGPRFVERAERRVRDGDHVRRLERPGVGRARQPVEQGHVAEQVARFHECDHRLTAVDRPIGHGDTT